MLYSDLEVSRLLVRERHEQLARDAARGKDMKVAWRPGAHPWLRARAVERNPSSIRPPRLLVIEGESRASDGVWEPSA